jgi:type I restriction enzyme S subunit
MEVKPGYKQTEVGVIPEEWEVARIADIADVKTGPFGSALHERDYVHDGTPIITVEHLGELGVTTNNLPLVSDADRHRLRSYSLDIDDIVFSRVGSVDRNALIRETEAGWLFSGRLLRVRPSKMRACSPYLSYQFHGESFKQRVRDVAVGQTMASLNTTILRNVKVVLPILPEQRAIAEALGDVDALIGGLEQLIAKKRDLKQAAMQQLLTGQTRLPGFSGEWEVKSIGELAGGDENIVDGPFGSDLKNSDYTPTGVPVLQGLNITGDRFIWKAIRFISDKKGTALFRSNAQIGDLLTVKIGSVGFSAIIEHLNGHQFAIIPANLLRVRFRNTRSDPRFVYYALTSTRGKRALRDLAANTAQPALSLAGFRRLPVAVPSCVEEQTAITLVLSDVDSEIEALEQRLAKTRALKQGMMQELLTGKTRLV